MEGLIIIFLVVYVYFLILFGVKESTRIKSVSFRGMIKLETLFIILPLLVSSGFALGYWGTFNNPHNGALILGFVIVPSASLVVLAEIIVFGFVRNAFTGIKALCLTLSVFLYLWFIATPMVNPKGYYPLYS